MRKTLALGLIILGLLAAMAATRWLTLPPPVRAANAPDRFDTAKARERLARVLGDQQPHPADSAASDGVRARLLGELRAMGLEPRLTDRFACNGFVKQRGVSCARVRNIVVTIGTPASAPHVLVNSHYDSVPVGPGASDAGLGVAAMLEAAFLMKDRPLVRPVTFLFNEGEESGLIGARAFLDADPLSRQVDALINLEARGTTGPVNMFETSTPNGAAVRLFGRSVSRPVANSLAVSAYRLLPNATDANTFVQDRDWLFLNFAPIGNETRYHSPGDDLAALDGATLQHMGDQLLEVGTALGSAATPEWRHGWDRLFTNIGTRWMLTLHLGTFLALLAGVTVGWFVRRRYAADKVPMRPIFTAIPVLLLGIALATAFAWLALTILGTLRDGQFWRAFPKATELAIYAGVIAAGLLVLAAAKRWTLPALRRAWWLLFLLIGLLLTLAAPGAMIFFIIPPILFAIGMSTQPRWRHGELAGTLAAALFTFVTLGATLGLLQEMLSNGPLWVFALFGSLVLMPWLIEARPLLDDARWRRVAVPVLALAALAWLPAALAPAYGPDRQQQWSLQYVVDPEARQPLWSVVNDRKALPQEWARFGDWRFGPLPFSPRGRWIAPAPLAAGLTPARLIPVESGSVAGGRLVRLRIEANGSNAVDLSAPGDADVRGLGIPGQLRRPATRGGSGRYRLVCTGRSCDGQVVELLLGPRPVPLLLVDTRWSLPPAARPLKAAQPRNARAQYVPDSTVLISRLTV